MKDFNKNLHTLCVVPQSKVVFNIDQAYIPFGTNKNRISGWDRQFKVPSPGEIYHEKEDPILIIPPLNKKSFG
jgi:hypothetical protein